ncbi:MAG: LacI family DNA-binding transcriptional regulator [bacterium]
MTKGRIKGGARLRDVAAAAGVSNATVSAVVNGRAEQYGICRATQEKVQAAVRQLGYTPSLAALDMVSGRNSLVGLAVSSDFPAAGRLIAALEPALSLAGHRLIVICLPTDPQVAAARISELIRFGIAGLVLFPARATALSGLNCPSVMIGGLPADTDPAAVVELGQTAARLLQQAIQGATTETIRLDPVIAPRVPVTPITPEPPVPVVVPVPVPVPVSVPAPQAPTVAVPVVPVPPVENPVVKIQPDPPFQSSETFQMPETPVLETTEPASPVVAAVPGGTESEGSIPVTEPAIEPIPVVDPVPVPDPVPVVTEPPSVAEPVPVPTPETPPVVEVPVVPDPLPEPVPVPEPEPVPEVEPPAVVVPVDEQKPDNGDEA